MWLEQLNALYRYQEYLKEADEHRLAHQTRSARPERSLSCLIRGLLGRWKREPAPAAAAPAAEIDIRAS